MGGALQRVNIHPLLLRSDDIQRQQPHSRGVNGHRGIHFPEGDPFEEATHITGVGDRNAHFAYLAIGHRVVRVITGLGGQIESN